MRPQVRKRKAEGGRVVELLRQRKRLPEEEQHKDGCWVVEIN